MHKYLCSFFFFSFQVQRLLRESFFMLNQSKVQNLPLKSFSMLDPVNLNWSKYTVFFNCELILPFYFDFLFSIIYRNAFKHELTLLEKVRHPNIVQFVGAVTQNIPMMIVSEHSAKVSIYVFLFQFKILIPTTLAFVIVNYHSLYVRKRRLLNDNLHLDIHFILVKYKIWRKKIEKLHPSSVF